LREARDQQFAFRCISSTKADFFLYFPLNCQQNSSTYASPLLFLKKRIFFFFVFLIFILNLTTDETLQHTHVVSLKIYRHQGGRG